MSKPCFFSEEIIQIPCWTSFCDCVITPYLFLLQFSSSSTFACYLLLLLPNRNMSGVWLLPLSESSLFEELFQIYH
jgi:hypothetical protein